MDQFIGTQPSGHASITIEGSNSSSNVSVFTVGPTTSHNFGALDTGADLDGVADIARITIVADPSQPGGSTFGGIRTANAMYSDDTGVVGIAADGVQVQSVVLIGDIDARNSGIPTLLFGDSSQFGTVQVAGGDLAQTNGEAINDGGFQTVSFIDGMTSDGVLQPSGTFLGAFISGEQRVTALDTSTEINIDGMSQAELDATFAGKTFTEDISIVGDLAQYQRISAGEFQKSITFDGDYAGSITVGTVGGDITFMGSESGRTISSNITAGSLGGSLTFGSDTGAANYSGILRTSSMAAEAIHVFGNFTGTVTTDGGIGDGSFDVGEGALGDINVSGDFSGNAVGILGIGNITVGGNLTSEGGAVFYTSSDDAPKGDSVGGIGTLTVMGDVDQDAGDMLINIANNGSFGAITLMGGGTDVGLISISGSLLGGSNGDISITGSYHVDVHGINVGDNSLGNITITGIAGTGVDGDKNKVSTLTLGNVVAGSKASIGNVSISGSDELSLDDIMTRTAGMLDFSANMSIAADGAITASHQLGSITFTGSTSINADITSAWMGDVMIDGNATFADGMGLVSGDRADAGDKAAASTGRLTSFEVTGNTTFDSTSGANIELATGGDFTFGGMVTGTASGTEIVASSLGDFSFSAALGVNQALVENLTVRATPGDGDKVAKDGSKATEGTNLSDYSIGNISVESTNTIGIPGASLFAGNNVFHALGAIGDISLLGGGSPNAQTQLFSTDMEDSLLLIVGDTTGDPTSAPTIDFDGDGTNDTFADIKKSTVSIGNVTINVGSDSSNFNSFVGAGDPDATAEARFTGMNILSGVYAASADQLNAVNDQFNIVDLTTAKETAQTNLITAQTNLDEILGDNDPAELSADVTEAETALGASAVADDPATTDVDEAKLATGAYLAVENAKAEVTTAQKALDAAQDAYDAVVEGNDNIADLLAKIGVEADPDAEPEITASTLLYLAVEEAQTALSDDATTDAARLALGTAADEAGETGSAYAQLAFAKEALTDAEEDLDAAVVAYDAAVIAHGNALTAQSGGITEAEQKAASLADYDLRTEELQISAGKPAYSAKAVVDGAQEAWNKLIDSEKLTQGEEAYIDVDGQDQDGWDDLVALGIDSWMEAGEKAWTDAFGAADGAGAGAANNAADTAGNTAYDKAGDDFDDFETADQIAKGREAFGERDDRSYTVILAALQEHVRAANIAGIPAVGDTTPGTLLYLAVDEAEEALGTAADEAGETGSAYAQLAFAQEAYDDAVGADDYVALVKAVTDSKVALAAAQLAHAQAVEAGTGSTTLTDVATAANALDAAKTALGTEADTASDDTAYGALAKAMDAVTDAKDALPAGLTDAQDALKTAQTTLDDAQKALDDAGAQSLGADEILVRNDADLEGTIGNVNIQNMTTLLTTNAVADITDDLSITIGSASGIVGATGVGSLDESKAGMIIGGDDSSLDEDELLVYVV